MKFNATFSGGFNADPNFSQGSTFPSQMSGGVLINGKSAYEIALDNGFKGTEDEWLASLQGEKGEKGERGEQGVQGERGERGLQGEQGLRGEKGEQGERGATGAQGPQGIQGVKGDKGDRGEQGLQGIQGIQGANGKDGADGFSPIVEMSKSGKVTTLKITDKNGAHTTEIKDGEDGQGGEGGTSVQSDWNVNDENDPAYVKNRTHWVENAFEPIYADNNKVLEADKIDASVLGLGLFVKISDQCLSLEQLEGAEIHATAYGDNAKSHIISLPPEEFMGFTMVQFRTVDFEGSDILYGIIFVAPSAMEIPEYGLSIPSAGTYISHNLTSSNFSWNVLIKKETIHQLDDMYVPYKRKYSITTALIVTPDGTEYSAAISQEDKTMLSDFKEADVAIRMNFGDDNIHWVVCTVVLAETAVGFTGCQIIPIEKSMYLIEWRWFGENNLKISARPFSPESYQTKSQVQAMIEEALGVIENGDY